MGKIRFFGFSVFIQLFLIGAIAVACAINGLVFYLFYNLIYGLMFSVLIPLLYVLKHKEPPVSLGIARVGLKQIVVLLAFVIFSIGGQLIPLLIEKTVIQWSHLSIGFFPLIMTTFFEEFLFRGFIQTRFEKMNGPIPAIMLSGLLFSLYHVGYPGFRQIADLVLLLAVGIGFSLAYKLSGNNLFVSYFVNFPNALLTYVLKRNQFPTFDGYSVIFAIVTIVLICVVMVNGMKKLKKDVATSY